VPALRRRPGLPAPAFRLPGGPTIPLLACGVTLAVVGSAGVRNLIAAGIALGAGLLVFALRRRAPPLP
jgi:hypothetical protein